MRPVCRTIIAVSSSIVVAVPVVAAQQAPQRPSAANFDISRAYVPDSTVYEPFLVTETQSLRDALAAGRVHDGTRVAVMEHRAGTLALLLEQLTYHHAAQGTLAGEPWMVSF